MCHAYTTLTFSLVLVKHNINQQRSFHFGFERKLHAFFKYMSFFSVAITNKYLNKRKPEVASINQDGKNQKHKVLLL